MPLSTPLWICPVRRPGARYSSVGSGHETSRRTSDSTAFHHSYHDQPLSPHGGVNRGLAYGELQIDVGIYGRVPNGKGVAYTKGLEKWGMEHRARKMLYRYCRCYAYLIYSTVRYIIPDLPPIYYTPPIPPYPHHLPVRLTVRTFILERNSGLYTTSVDMIPCELR